MAIKLIVAMSACLFVSASANAQVWKCKNDSTGKIEYSGISCDTKSTGTAVNAAPNEIDSSGSREAIDRANTTKTAEGAQEARRRQAAATDSALNTRASNSEKANKACADAESEYRNAKNRRAAPDIMQPLKNRVRIACSSEPTGVSPRTMPAPGVDNAAQPSAITNCDAAGCWDNLGNRYNKGTGTTYFPANGGHACQLIGGQMQCP